MRVTTLFGLIVALTTLSAGAGPTAQETVAAVAGEVGDDASSATDAVAPGDEEAGPLPAGLACAVQYTRHDVVFDWFDTSDGHAYDGFRDDDLWAFRMPFPFVYFGESVDEITLSDDGWLSFFEGVDGDLDSSHDPLPDPSPPAGVIAPFWADLDPWAGSTVPDQRLVYVKTFGVAPHRALVITYDRFPRHDLPDTEYTFQVAFYETTNNIRFQYSLLDGNRSDMAIGIEDEAGATGYEFARGRAVDLEDQAMEWRPVRSPVDCRSAVDLVCGVDLVGQMMNGSDIQVQYGCDGGLYRASERLYRLSLDAVTLVDLQVSPNNPARNLAAFLMSSCNPCNCWDGGPDGFRTVLGPGEYYVAVDGPIAADSGPFDLSLRCETLLSAPTGHVLDVGGGGCGLELDFDRFADGRAVWAASGWTPIDSDRNYHALRVDGTTVYANNQERSSCTEFTAMGAWVNDDTDTAISYWRADEADIIQTIRGQEEAGCCGVEVRTRIINRDVFAHSYELRSLLAMEFGAGVMNCAGEPRVEAGPLHVDPSPTDFLVEQDLGCGGGGVCAVECRTPAELKSADDLTTRLVAQVAPETNANDIEAEWVRYFDVNRICDPSLPEPWTGGYLPVAEDNSLCEERAALLHSWRFPPGGGDLAPGEEATVTFRLGDGCRLDQTCPQCQSFASLQAPSSKACVGVLNVLDASGSTFVDCIGGGPVFEWQRDGIPTGIDTPTYTVDEPMPGTHTYAVEHRCEPPPAGLPCVDSVSTAIQVFDCDSCSISASVIAPTLEVCVDQEFVLDALAIVSDCPGTLSYEWRRSGAPIPGETDQLLTRTEPAAGDITFNVRAYCAAPPVGLDCSDLSAPVQIRVVSGTTVPPELGNTLKLVRRGQDVQIDWLGTPVATSYDVLRGTSKLDLPLPGPALLLVGLAGAPALDVAAVPAPPAFYVYRARASNCGGAGPY